MPVAFSVGNHATVSWSTALSTRPAPAFRPEADEALLDARVLGPTPQGKVQLRILTAVSSPA